MKRRGRLVYFAKSCNNKFSYCLCFKGDPKKGGNPQKWCEDISKETNTQWKSLKVSQVAFDRLKSAIKNFSDLISKLTTEESSQGMFDIEK